MEAMLNQMRRAAMETGSSRAATRHGIIDGYDPNAYAVKVRLQPDDTLTDWMPLKAIMVGNGFGIFVAPNIGDVVEISFQEDDGGVGSAGWRFFHNQARPLTVPAGEIWLVHQSGSSIKLTTDGKTAITDKAGSTIVMNGDGTGTMTFASGLTVNADVTVNGKITATGEVTGNGKALSTHKHTGVQTGTGVSGQPQ